MKNTSLKIAILVMSVVAIRAYGGSSTLTQKKELTGTWVYTGKRLTTPVSDSPVQNFGNSIAAMGNWLFIGALYFGSDMHASEAVFVYHLESSHWKYIQVLSTESGSIGYGFTLGKNIAFISGYLTKRNKFGRNPVIFIYKQTNGQWIKTGLIGVRSNGALLYNGRSLFSRDKNNSRITIFNSRGKKWYLSTKVNTHIHHWPIGSNLAVAANRFVTLFYGSGGFEKGQGAVTVYDRSGKRWVRTSVITPSGKFKKWDFDSCTIAPDGNAIFIVARLPMSLSELTSKPVYKLHRHIRVLMYEKHIDRWELVATGKPANPSLAYSFGKNLMVDESELFVGAPSASMDGRGYSNGLVYVFKKERSRLILVARLSSGKPKETWGFGSAIAETKNMLMVGAPFASTSPSTWHQGAVYIFDRRNKE